MKQMLEFRQLNPNDGEMCQIFEALMKKYMEEMEEHDPDPLPKELLEKWIKSIINIQGAQDRHLEFCYNQKELVGFLYGKIDHEEHRGFIKPGYGFIMEFYVLPEYRRKGYGKEMFQHLENLFRQHGAKRMYLTADPVTGKPFWEALGFQNTGVQSPDNQLDIYEKYVSAYE